MEQEYSKIEELEMPQPHLYTIFFKSGKEHRVSGFLGLHENYVVVANNDGRLIWGCSIDSVDRFESPETGHSIPSTKQ